MKLAFISDTHFGDQMCTLVNYRTLKKGTKFDGFAEAAGKNNDFLVLLGDIFDFSITSYEEAYKRAKVFFQLVKENRIAKNIIYVPGNHDFDMWHTVQQQIKIIYQVRKGKPALSFRWSLPGLIDDRSSSSKRGFLLPGVIDEPVNPDRKPSAERMFLNGITKNPDGGGSETNFYIAYPNLYMVTDKESVFFTHGHYLETFWVISGEWIRRIAREDLSDADRLEDIVALNVPLCQLSCSGIGQAGKLTAVVQRVQRDVKDGVLGDVKKYAKRFEDALDELTKVKLLNPKSWVREWMLDKVSKEARKEFIKSLEERDDTRYSEAFVEREDVQQRFIRYYQASWKEIRQLNREFSFAIKQPRKMIFGHTHRPIKWAASNAPTTTVNGKSVRLYNTGGWLWKKSKNDTKEFCGAEVFKYDSVSGFDSRRVT